MKRTHDDLVGDEHHEDSTTDDAETNGAVDKFPPYDATKEKLPQNPVFTPEYTELTSSVQSLIDLLAEPLRESEYCNEVINGLMEEITIRTRSSFPEEVRIALIGDMKSGKSSVINSLLSVGMIARQGDAGCSCTWVVNEFCYLLPKQSKTFAAEVHFFTADERHEIIAALFADYWRASPKDSDETDGPKDSDQNVEDFTVMATTITAFRALFNNQDVFATMEAADKFLSSAKSENDEAILETLYDWADELMAKGLGGDSFIFAEANTTQGLLWELAPYLYTVEEREGQPIISTWPFVNHIKFGLDNPLLMNNVTLVDLPGLSDSNKIRVKNAKLHLRSCTQYMIVAEIGRAGDDKSIRENLSRGCMTRGSGRTMLVLTHADTIDEATTVHPTHKESQRLDKLRSEIKPLARKRTELTGRIKSAKGAEKWEYMEAKEEVMLQLRAKETEHEACRIGVRSRNIASQMQQLYARLTPDPIPLPVFCVGNSAYRKHQAGYAQEDPNPPSLTVDATRIPALRQHLFLAPAEGKVNETKHQVTRQLPALIACFGLYVAKTHMARKDEVEEIVIEPQGAIIDHIKAIFQDLEQQMEQKLFTPLCENENYWTDEARILCRRWAKMYSTAMHLQFLKKDGLRRQRGKGAEPISWNSDLVSIFAGETRNCLGELSDALKPLHKFLTKEASKLVNTMINKIRGHPQVTLMALNPFLELLYVEKGVIETLVDRPLKSLRRGIGEITNEATFESDDNGIVKAMAPIYNKARQIKGRLNAPKDRLRYFENEVCRRGDGVWTKAHESLRHDMGSLLQKHEEELACILKDFFIGFNQKFNTMCADRDTEDEEEGVIRDKLKVNLAMAREMLEKEVRPAYEKCFGKS